MKIDIINTYNSYTYFANAQNPNLMSTHEEKALLAALPEFIINFYGEQSDDKRKILLDLFKDHQKTTLEEAIEKLKKSGIKSIVARIKYDGMTRVLDEFIKGTGKAPGVGGETWGPILLGSLVNILATYNEMSQTTPTRSERTVLKFLNELIATIELPWAAMGLNDITDSISGTLLLMYQEISFAFLQIIIMFGTDPVADSREQLLTDTVNDCFEILPSLRSHSKRIRLEALFQAFPNSKPRPIVKTN